MAENSGICRIVPPSSWNPPENDMSASSTFVTQIQRIDGAEVPCSPKKKSSTSEGTNGNKKRSSRMGLDIESGNGHATNFGAFGQEPGPKFTFKDFKKYADDFKAQYFCKSEVGDSNVCPTSFQKQWEPSLEDIEGEYRRIIENPTEEIEVCLQNDD